MTRKSTRKLPLKQLITVWTIAPYLFSGVSAESSFAVVSFVAAPVSVQAQSTSSDQTTSGQTTSGQNNSSQTRAEQRSARRPIRYTPPDFSDVGRPTDRTGGGSRGPCSVPDMPPLTALIPDTNTGFTLTESPTFWFYVPYTLTSDQAIEFVLKDEQDNTLYTTKASGTGTTPGITSLRLPSNIALEANKNYEWYFLVYCDAQNQERFVYVNGVVRRIERPDLETQLASIPAEARANLYATEGVWHDALTHLAERLRVAPEDDQVVEDWSSLLQSVGLDHLASESFVSCCSTEK